MSDDDRERDPEIRMDLSTWSRWVVVGLVVVVVAGLVALTITLII